jgi:uncharacterized lipoprotein
MKNSALLTVLAASVLALAGCGKSDSAKEQANPDNVEMPAEETVQPLPADATPVADASAAAGAEGASSPTPAATSTTKP